METEARNHRKSAWVGWGEDIATGIGTNPFTSRGLKEIELAGEVKKISFTKWPAGATCCRQPSHGPGLEYDQIGILAVASIIVSATACFEIRDAGCKIRDISASIPDLVSRIPHLLEPKWPKR